MSGFGGQAGRDRCIPLPATCKRQAAGCPAWMSHG